MSLEHNHVLSVHRLLPETEVEAPPTGGLVGPRLSYSLFGCVNVATWSFSGGYQATVADLFALIRKQVGVEGVTFIGGEPFSQARGLAALGWLCRQHGLSVVTFTGYEYNRLLADHRDDWNALLAVTDLLLAGPFLEEQRDFTRPWVGSRNQEFIYLTERYRNLTTRDSLPSNGLEIQISSSGDIRLNGLAPGRRHLVVAKGIGYTRTANSLTREKLCPKSFNRELM